MPHPVLGRHHSVLILKGFREHRATLIACWLALVAAEVLIALAYRAFGTMYDSMLSMMSSSMMSAFYGGSLIGINAEDGWTLGGFVHPLVMLLLSAFTIAVSTRSLAGEIERGTIDILLAYPVARVRLIAAGMVVCVVGLALLIAAIYAGAIAGALLAGTFQRVNFFALGLIALNLFALFLAIGAYAFLFSAFANERGRATAWAAGMTAASWFVNFLSELWDRLQPFNVFSVFHYYRVQPILITSRPPWRDLLVLCTVATLTFAAAAIRFRRRDIATI